MQGKCLILFADNAEEAKRVGLFLLYKTDSSVSRLLHTADDVVDVKPKVQIGWINTNKQAEFYKWFSSGEKLHALYYVPGKQYFRFKGKSSENTDSVRHILAEWLKTMDSQKLQTLTASENVPFLTADVSLFDMFPLSLFSFVFEWLPSLPALDAANSGEGASLVMVALLLFVMLVIFLRVI